MSRQKGRIRTDVRVGPGTRNDLHRIGLQNNEIPQITRPTAIAALNRLWEALISDLMAPNSEVMAAHPEEHSRRAFSTFCSLSFEFAGAV